MKEDLNQLLDLVTLARKLDNTFKRTFLSSAVPSVGVVAGVFFFHMTLATAIMGYLLGMGLSVSQAMLPLLEEQRIQRKAK